MVRKLLMSVIGSFWSTQSPMAIATALLLSVFFLLLQAMYQPYVSPLCNRVQQACLAATSFFYFAGLMLQFRKFQVENQDTLGVLLVLLLVLALCSVAYAIVLMVLEVHKQVLEKRKLDKELAQKPDLFNAEEHGSLIDYSELMFGKVLGRGAQGTVRQAMWKDEEVAVKVMKLDIENLIESGAAEQLEEVKTEALALNRLEHPNIVKFYGVSFKNTEVNLCLCIILQLCSRSLNDEIDDKDVTLTWSQKLRYLLDVAQGMQHMHSVGVYHRDLKPANVLLDSSGEQGRVTAKVTDFGTSKIAKEGDKSMTTNIGSPVFMAPEIMVYEEKASGSPALTDVYAFGCTMYAVMAKMHLYKDGRFEGANIWVLREAINGGARPDLECESLAGIPPAAKALMEECWAGKPDERPADFQQICQRLQLCIESQPDKQEGGDSDGERAPTNNPMFDNPALRASMRKLNVNDADTGNGRAVHAAKSANVAGQEQTI